MKSKKKPGRPARVKKEVVENSIIETNEDKPSSSLISDIDDKMRLNILQNEIWHKLNINMQSIVRVTLEDAFNEFLRGKNER